MARLLFVLPLSMMAACGGQGIEVSGTGGSSVGVSSVTGGSGGVGGSRGTGGASVQADAAFAADASTSNDEPLSPCRAEPYCPSDWYRYADRICWLAYPSGDLSCTSNGDGLCYRMCEPTSGCPDPKSPCSSITVFDGSDYGQSKYVCKSEGSVLACPSAAGGAGSR